jgi:hypothetical protein
MRSHLTSTHQDPGLLFQRRRHPRPWSRQNWRRRSPQGLVCICVVCSSGYRAAVRSRSLPPEQPAGKGDPLAEVVNGQGHHRSQPACRPWKSSQGEHSQSILVQASLQPRDVLGIAVLRLQDLATTHIENPRPGDERSERGSCAGQRSLDHSQSVV